LHTAQQRRQQLPQAPRSLGRLAITARTQGRACGTPDRSKRPVRGEAVSPGGSHARRLGCSACSRWRRDRELATDRAGSSGRDFAAPGARRSAGWFRQIVWFEPSRSTSQL
jgi:hypothetical protein